MSKLQNTKAIKQFLDGSHRTQTRTVTGWNKKAQQKRKVGEKWVDEENGQIWEQMEGFRIKHGKLDELRDYLHMPSNCPQCKNEMKKRLDKKYWGMHKMCSDCAILMETHLMCKGKYSEYELSKMKNNAESWLKDAERDKDLLKEVLTKNEYVNADGTFEKWSLPESPEVMRKKIDEQFEEFKNGFAKTWSIKDDRHDSKNESTKA